MIITQHTASTIVCNMKGSNITWEYLRTITVHFGPCEKDGSSVWECEVYSGRHPMSKRTLDFGDVKVIKREISQAIALATGRKCR